MSITIVEPTTEERIRRQVDSGRYEDAGAVVSKAVEMLERAENLRIVRALVAEAEESIARGEVYDMTDTFWEEIWAEADEEDRLGIPIPDHLKP